MNNTFSPSGLSTAGPACSCTPGPGDTLNAAPRRVWAGIALLVACSTLSLAQAQGLRPTPQLTSPRVVSGSAGSVQRSADYIVAVVNSEPVTNNEVRARVVRFEQQLSQRGGAMPPRAELLPQMLERLISERAQVQLARENGIKVDELAVDTAVQNVARQNQISVDELRSRLLADGIAYSQFRADLRDEILLTRVRDREVDTRITISELDIDRYILEQQDSVDVAALDLNIAQILVAVPENASPAQLQALQAKAQNALDRARKGDDFAALAREFSDAPDKAAGGVIGLRNAQRYPTLFVDAVQNLRAGALADLVRSGAGFHVLKLVEKKQAGLPGITVSQTRSRHILLKPSPQLSENAAREQLAALRVRIAAGQLDFAAAAKEFSQDGSAKDGGNLGWANPGQFVPEFEEVLNSLAPGQLSQPLISRFGVHLIELQERRENTLSPREQREIARGQLRERKLEDAFITWAQDVRARAYVELREPPQ